MHAGIIVLRSLCRGCIKLAGYWPLASRVKGLMKGLFFPYFICLHREAAVIADEWCLVVNTAFVQ